MKLQNIFEKLPDNFDDEYFETLIETGNLKLERIISDGHSTKENYWYDHDKNEFVMLLKGSAVILFDNGEEILMKPGDHLIIPAHKKHRVEKTADDEKTFWLALHY